MKATFMLLTLFTFCLLSCTNEDSEKSLHIGLLKQKTYIELNESGTEAAAVTIGGMTDSAAPSPFPVDIRFDHPFGYVLKEKSTGAILFAGKVGKPE